MGRKGDGIQRLGSKGGGHSELWVRHPGTRRRTRCASRADWLPPSASMGRNSFAAGGAAPSSERESMFSPPAVPQKYILGCRRLQAHFDAPVGMVQGGLDLRRPHPRSLLL